MMISIIIPVYNTEKYLRTCLDSVIDQTFTDFEVVLVNDGSTDGSGKICDEYAQKDSRFVVVHKQNEGVAKARLTAFEHSKGELITFIDSDDIVDPEYLSKLSAPILHENADMVSCDFCYGHDDGRKSIPRAKLTGTFEGKDLKDFISNHYFYDPSLRHWGMTQFLCTKMVKREFVKEALLQGIGLWFGEDQIGTFHILYHVHKLVLIPDRLYYYMRHDTDSANGQNKQASDKYDESLWTSMIEMLEKAQLINQENLGAEQFRQRIWHYITFAISNKLIKSGLSCSEFSRHLSKMRNTSFMKKFFKPMSIDFGRNEKIKYWLLKLKLFPVLFMLIRK